MAELGSLSLYIALILALYSIVGSLFGVSRNSPSLLRSSQLATYMTLPTLIVATISLVIGFVTKDFEIEYVYAHSSQAMEHIYTWVAFYAGNEGSLLFIALMLSVMTAMAMLFSPSSIDNIRPYVISVLMSIQLFFLAVIILLANPFTKMLFIPEDGQGINPLLTHPGMFIHPPMLMTGLIAATVPFAFGIGALIAGKTGDEWVDSGRIWGIVSWAILGIGLLLGAWWAYTILGWGGYWGWDPIENAGLMPWLGMTAFIHSIMVQKRRGMFRMWNIVLIIVTFGLAQFGMFLNRGGPVVSVHSFAASSLGWIFLAFMAFTMIFSFSLFFFRYDKLKADRSIESPLSREVAFLINNLLLLLIAFVTMWGAIFPLITQVFKNQTVSIGAPFYTQVNGPLFLILVFLMGIAPLLPWRKTALSDIKYALLFPTTSAVLFMLILFIIGVHQFYPLIAFGLSSMVLFSISREWYKGTRLRAKRTRNIFKAFVNLITSNRPRYGGYIVHIAIIFLAFGVAGSSFYKIQEDIILAPGESVTIADYDVKYLDSRIIKKSDHTQYLADLTIYKNSREISKMTAWRAYYPDFRMASTKAAIRSTLLEDLYIINSEFLDDGSGVFRITVNPLVIWIWIAGPILIFGTVIALWPQAKMARSRIKVKQLKNG